jgi:hypothetical protein
VPAGVERMTAQQATQCEPATPHHAEPFDRLDCVGTARRGVAARRRQRRADCRPVEADQPKDRTASKTHRDVLTSRASAASRSAPNWAEVAWPAPVRARTTVPLRSGSRSRRWASCARSRRLTRCRTTLPPTDLPTTRPTTGRPGVRSGNRCTTRCPLRARAPARTTDANSVERRIRFADGNTGRRGGADDSGRQLATTLAATGRHDRATRAGTHAQPESVRLGATAVVRLEGALAHGRTPSLSRSDARCRVIACVRSATRSGDGVAELERRTAQTVPRYGSRASQVKPTVAESGKLHPLSAAFPPTRRSLLSSSTGTVRFAHRATLRRVALGPSGEGGIGVHSLWTTLWIRADPITKR